MYKIYKFIFLICILMFVGYTQLCPENCQYDENTTSCYCYSNVTGWFPVYDFVIGNYTLSNFTNNNISMKVIYYNFTDSFNYVGNISNCLYLDNNIIKLENVYLNGSKNYTGNFTIDFCISPESKFIIVLNCDYSVNEVNYSNNNVSFYNDLLKCSENFDSLEESGAVNTPENPYYIFFILIFVIYFLFIKSKN